MKRLICLFLILCLFLSGCSIFEERIKEPVTFYYLQAEYSSEMSEVIATEEREAAGHREDLSYLMALYMMGPSEETLASPIPRGTRVFTVEQTLGGIILNLSDTTETMTDMEFSLACACLALTCLDMTEAAQVTINSGGRTVTMSRDNLTLVDNSTSITVEDVK